MIEGRDFTCTRDAGVLTCRAADDTGHGVYRALQQRLGLPDDGRLGARAVVLLQPVLRTLHRTTPLPPSLQQIVLAPSAEGAIRSTAAAVPELLQYLDFVLARFPDALTNPPAPPAPAPLRGFQFPVRPALFAAAGAAVLGGLGYVAHRVTRRASGVEDARHFLPPDQDDGDESDE